MVDDGSMDGSSKICDTFVENDCRFLVVHKKNGGLVSARKAGAEIATGDYILNIDGDDYVNIDMLKVMSDIIEKNEPDAVYFGYKVFGGNRDGDVLNVCNTGLYVGRDVDFLRSTYLYNKNIPGINSGTILFSICAKCIKRELYKICQDKVPNYIVSGEDTIFNMCLSKIVKKIYVSDYTGYFYRQSKTSIEHDFSAKKIKDLYVTYGVLYNLASDDVVFQNAVNVYLFYRFWFYLCGIGIYAKNYLTYRKSVSDIEEFGKLVKGRITISHNIQSKIKYFMVKNKCYLAIYFLSKMYFKNKLEL